MVYSSLLVEVLLFCAALSCSGVTISLLLIISKNTSSSSSRSSVMNVMPSISNGTSSELSFSGGDNERSVCDVISSNCSQSSSMHWVFKSSKMFIVFSSYACKSSYGMNSRPSWRSFSLAFTPFILSSYACSMSGEIEARIFWYSSLFCFSAFFAASASLRAREPTDLSRHTARSSVCHS